LPKQINNSKIIFKKQYMGILDKIFGNKNNDTLAALISEGAFLVDVREPAEVAEGGVNGAVNIPLGNVLANVNAFKDKKHIVVFCRSGNRSGQAKVMLEQNGFTNVTNGGTWQDVNNVVNK
jgi:phage shock protein E